MGILKIHTDGACSGNQNKNNIGGWGAILEYGTAVRELHGGERNTTNNRMEMMALIQAMSVLKRDGLTVEVYSDSAYLMDCFRKKWYEGWRRNGWMTSSRTPVLNQDLWILLLESVEKNEVEFFRVKGHVRLDPSSGDVRKYYKKFCQWNGEHFTMEEYLHVTEMNHRADALANLAMDEIRAGKA